MEERPGGGHAIDGYPRCGAPDRNRHYRHCGRDEVLPLRTGVCGVSGVGSPPEWDGWQGPITGDQQTGRHLSPIFADSWSQGRGELPDQESEPLDRQTAQPTAPQCGRSGTGQQDGQNDLGTTGEKYRIRRPSRCGKSRCVVRDNKIFELQQKELRRLMHD